MATRSTKTNTVRYTTKAGLRVVKSYTCETRYMPKKRQYSAEEVADMRRRLAAGETRASVMRAFGVKSPQRFRNILASHPGRALLSDADVDRILEQWYMGDIRLSDKPHEAEH